MADYKTLILLKSKTDLASDSGSFLMVAEQYGSRVNTCVIISQISRWFPDYNRCSNSINNPVL